MGIWLRGGGGGSWRSESKGAMALGSVGGKGLDVEGSGWVRGILGCMRGGEHGLGFEGKGLEL